MLLSDTVGFIRRLPHELIAAFRATLQEVIETDLLLHVIDITDSRIDETIAEVEKVLKIIEADHIQKIYIFNKIDKVDGVFSHVESVERGLPAKLWLSANTGEGCSLLLRVLEDYFSDLIIKGCFHLVSSEADLRAKLYRLGAVLNDEGDGNGGWRNLEVEVSRSVAPHVLETKN